MPPSIHKIAAVALTGAALVTSSLFMTGCTVSTGERSGGGSLAGTTTGPVWVSITSVELTERGPARDLFWQQMNLLNEQLPEEPGLISYRLRRELLGNGAWTMSIWEDRAAMRAFVRSRGHATAMKLGTDGVAEMAFVTFEMDAQDLPLNWKDAMTRLERDGRPYAY